jgi:serine/threonine-protein kinase RsbW
MTDSERVVLSVPARGEFARTVRLVAAEIATRVGMSIDDIDDVRLAVEEAFVYAADRADTPSVTVAFALEPGSIELLVGPLPLEGRNAEAGEAGERYARFILEAICDEFELLQRDGSCYVRLVKRTA